MLNRRRRSRRNRGFTLIEIMIVIAIVALLGSVVTVNVISRWKKAQVDGTRVQLASYEQALQAYYLDNNRYPHTSQGLEALVSKPTNGKIPRNYAQGGYMKKVADDPWGTPYRYVCDDYQNYSISSDGPDGEPDTEDDVYTDDDGGGGDDEE